MYKVRNMESSRGNNVPNQFIIFADNKIIFQSYETVIAIKGKGITLDTNALDYSRTTSKYLYQFLGLNRKEIENKIKTGDIVLKNLN